MTKFGPEVMISLVLLPRVCAALLPIALMSACGQEAAERDPVAAPVVVESPLDAGTLCDRAALQWDGEATAARLTTVDEVRRYTEDPHGAAEDPSAPVPGAYAFPASWQERDGETPVAACYIDGGIPKGQPPALDGTTYPIFNRQLVVAGEDLPSLLLMTGYRDQMPAEPLTAE